MIVLKEHIKSGDFKQFYLIYGNEPYLIKLYRDKLRDAILGNADRMNFSRFEGKDIDLKEVNAIAQTLPFFSDRRLILIENSELFKSQSDLAEILSEAPESSIFIFVEKEVDKRNKSYKFIKDKGIVSEMNTLDEKNLKLFIASLLKSSGKKITESTASYLLEKIGTEMESISNEVEKLISYTWDKDTITNKDVDEIVTGQITGKIFQMMDAIGLKQQNKALTLYYDLLSVRERPSHILYLITRHFNILLQIKDLIENGYAPAAITDKVAVPAFTVSKYISQARNFTKEQLIGALKLAADTEEQIKTGRLQEQIGTELLIIQFSSN